MADTNSKRKQKAKTTPKTTLKMTPKTTPETKALKRAKESTSRTTRSLTRYRQKRDFDNTPEPAPHKDRTGTNGALTFVVQKHSARRLHYDFRLEVGGVLVSWAVPKGPSLNPADKRLAAMTEDHPLDYASFEGVIPDGAYGAGPVIVWDEGLYTPDDGAGIDWKDRRQAERKMLKALKDGKISIFLKGHKLKGSFSLVRMKKNEKDWLLIKHRDEYATADTDIVEDDQSVVSKRTIEDVEARRRGSTSNKASKFEGSKAAPFLEHITPMLATLADGPFSDPAWSFEPKMDGIRAVAYLRGRNVHLESRRGLDLTTTYPTLGNELKAHTQKGLILDGEIVALDEKGRPSFQLLQQRSGLSRPSDLKTADANIPVYYYVFDILYLNGSDLRGVRQEDRRKLLKHTLVTSDHVRLIETFPEDGVSAYKACVENGLEGVVGKRLDSTYESRRARSWVKVKATRTDEFLIGGYTRGTGSRSKQFGSLLLGYYEGGRLVYAGNVGTGFDEKTLGALLGKLEPLKAKECPFSKKPAGQPTAVWVKPELVAEVKFSEWTKDKMLRAPVFEHLRQDKAPKEVHIEPSIHVKDMTKKNGSNQRKAKARADGSPDEQISIGVLEQLEEKGAAIELDVGGQKIALSSLDKEFWPPHSGNPAVTKRDLIRYFTRVSPYLLPHMKDRPLTLLRFPNGITKAKFYQKHFEKGLPEFVETVTLYSQQNDADQEYVLVNNLPTLLWLGQLADLELHTWMSRISAEPDAPKLPRTFTGSVKNIEKSLLNYPDFIVFDLDPYIYSGKEATGAEPELNKRAFAKTVEIALEVKRILESMSLRCYIKTTGRTGLHLYLSIIRNLMYSEVRAAAEQIGRFIVSQRPDEVTTEWSVAKRTGKIFFDYNMNTRGKTLASIYSPRSYPNASVSVPVAWTELHDIYPTDFTIRNVPDRLLKMGDMWADILLNKNDLTTLTLKKKNAR